MLDAVDGRARPGVPESGGLEDREGEFVAAWDWLGDVAGSED